MLGVHLDGGMADYVCVPEANVVAADGVTLDQAATVEFLAIGAHAAARRAARGRPRAGRRRGPHRHRLHDLRQAARRFGHGARHARRPARFLPRQLAVDHTVAAGADARRSAVALTDGDFFDFVFDATGNSDAMNAGFAYVAHGGAYVLVSIVRDDFAFADPEFHKRETTLLGSRNATPGISTKCSRPCAGLVPTDALITHRATLSEAPAVFPNGSGREPA